MTRILDGPAPDATRAIAAWALGLAGPNARDAVPILRGMLTDPYAEARRAASEALPQIGAPPDGPVRYGKFDKLSLPEEERKRIWEIEHGVNVLNKYGFEPLSEALLKRDAKGIAGLLAPDFAGSQPGAPKRVKSPGVAEVERIQESDKSSVALSAGQFADLLIGWRDVVASSAKIKIVAAKLQPLHPGSPRSDWVGEAIVRIHGESRPGAPAEVTATIDFAVTAPTQESLTAGGWLRVARIRQVAVARAPRPLFKEKSQAHGLNTELHDNWETNLLVPTSGGVYVTDFDRDGYLDVLINDVTGDRLYRGGANGRFTDVTEQVGLPPPTPVEAAMAVAWVDLDGDGWDDLILNHEVYRNENGVKFTNYSGKTSLRIPANVSAILIADFDRDGKLDLYLTRSGPPGNMSWLQGRSNNAQGNRLLRNLGDWKFEDVTKKSRTRGDYRSCFTAAWLDAERRRLARPTRPQRIRRRRAPGQQSRRHIRAAFARGPSRRFRHDGARSRRPRQRWPDRHLLREHVLQGRDAGDRQHASGLLSRRGDAETPPPRRGQPAPPQQGRPQVRPRRRREATRERGLGLWRRRSPTSTAMACSTSTPPRDT